MFEHTCRTVSNHAEGVWARFGSQIYFIDVSRIFIVSLILLLYILVYQQYKYIQAEINHLKKSKALRFQMIHQCIRYKKRFDLIKLGLLVYE